VFCFPKSLINENGGIKLRIANFIRGNDASICLSGDDADQDGCCSYIFANPEVLILNEKWSKMPQTTVYQKNLFGIVADEAHVIPKWEVDRFHLRISSRMLCTYKCLAPMGGVRAYAGY